MVHTNPNNASNSITIVINLMLGAKRVKTITVGKY
jgi:hypothetical protein